MPMERDDVHQHRYCTESAPLYPRISCDITPFQPADSNLTGLTVSVSPSCNHKSLADKNLHSLDLQRHLSLFDLVCIGVGATVGSGVYVLTGLIAHSLAGPATFISWSVAGGAACASGLCYAELGGRFPSAGSSYVYAKETMGEFASVIAGACLTLEYVGSASAVARSWGDKVVEYIRSREKNDFESTNFILLFLDPGMGINPCAFLVSAGAVILLLGGVRESKFVTNLFTTLNVSLLLFMALLALILVKSENMTPLIPREFGASGIFRGATSSFFGYIGFDEICCVAGEAVNPARNMPRAIIFTLIIVTILYVSASVGLVGMVPYESISETSGFPDGFRYRGFNWAAEISAIGELIALPFVVLVTIMAQPRLQYAMAKDGLLPPIFAEVDGEGNLIHGLKISGALMVFVATMIPFSYLNDLVSSGILLAFTMTDASVILVRRRSPSNKPFLLERLLILFIGSSLLSGFLLRSWQSKGVTMRGTRSVAILSCFGTTVIGLRMKSLCPRQNFSGHGIFLTPFVPILPLVGIFINLYLIAQLELTGLLMISGYVALAVGMYLRHKKNRNVDQEAEHTIERQISLEDEH